MSRTTAWVLVLLLLGALVTAAYLALEAGTEAGRGMPAYSVYSNEADGLATAADVLRRLGYRPRALTRQVQPERHRGLLILAEPGKEGLLPGEREDLTDAEVRRLLRWVEEGNTLALLAGRPTRLHDALGVALTRGRADPGVQFAKAEEVGGYTEPGGGGRTQRVEDVGLETEATVQARRAVPLWMVGDQPGGLLVPRGSGRVLVMADPSVWTHRGLLRADNVLLLYNVAALDAQDGVVYFDEYHHGIRAGGGYWDYVRLRGLQWDFLQLLAVALAAGWAAAVRLGPAVSRPRAGQADTVDYASAVARIYQRVGVRHLLARQMVRDFWEALTAHLRLRRASLPAQVLAAWRQRHPGDSGERLTELLRGVALLRRVAAGAEEVSERELLSWARALDGFLKEHQLPVRAGPLPAADL